MVAVVLGVAAACGLRLTSCASRLWTPRLLLNRESPRPLLLSAIY